MRSCRGAREAPEPYSKIVFSVNLEGRLFFSEEKKQKTFISLAASRLAMCLDLAARAGIKVFWFFSSEKNGFLSNH